MMNFTNNPMEKLMKQRPRGGYEKAHCPPPNSPCRGCSFWQGAACIGVCYKKLLFPQKDGEATSGQIDPKLL